MPRRRRHSSALRLAAALSCCLALSLPLALDAEFVVGHAASRDGFAFMAKFVFGVSDPTHPVVHPTAQILGYTDPTHGSCGRQGADVPAEWMQTVAITLHARHPSISLTEDERQQRFKHWSGDPQGLRVYLYDDRAPHRVSTHPAVILAALPRTRLRSTAICRAMLFLLSAVCTAALIGRRCALCSC